MEAKKSHELASASRRTRKACGVTQSYYKSLRTRGAKGVRPNLNLKAQEAGAPMSQGRRRAVPQFKQSRLALFCFFVTSRPSMDWTMSTHTGDGDCHYQFADSNANANLFWKYLPKMIPIQKMIFYKLSGHPLAQSRWHKINHHRDCSHEIKTLAPWNRSCDKPGQHIKKQRHHFADKGPYSQSYGFSSSHVWMWDLEHKEGWE